ncbi:D-2-hydroxyacid dehydrogenase [Marinoscillum furvescens]|uniref:Glycerate dehydrogenase n=1 Tax=Marinoscillum furvescens DSM 4134 TaxID=1122208 RepID=A0A3D9KYY9_MARFU|nr:D-2-hydroxyacid dehydrogenase [Marinoscillum furvescens]RED94897.1 glycerate dehydrogenase [Marinoscillum furvescens DSM 4134]
MSHNIVILDGIYANPGDLSWEGLEAYGTITTYEQTAPDEVVARAKDASILIINKIKLGEAHFEQLPNLQLVIISATGMDNVDLKAAEKHDIPVKNVVGYSTESVAQHVMAMLLNLTNLPESHSESVKKGNWNENVGFSYTLQTIPELSGKSIGIYGFGQIGQRVAELAQAFGMTVNITSNHAQPSDYPDYHLMPLDELFQQSDVISLHAPLRADNKEIVNKSLLAQAKPGAILINTARGGLINENDLHEALKSGPLAAAGLDVMNSEPPSTSHPLFELSNCIITPHMAWASIYSRSKLIEGVVEHVANFASN